MLAWLLYAERFRNRWLPNRRTFVKISQSLSGTGSLHPRFENQGQRRHSNNLQTEEEILNRS